MPTMPIQQYLSMQQQLPIQQQLPTQQLFGLPIFAGQKEQALQLLQDILSSPSHAHQQSTNKKGTNGFPFVVFTPNPEQIVLSLHNQQFARTLCQANLLLPDGVGLVWASTYLGKPLTERIAGVDVIASLLPTLSQLHQKVLIVGGRNYEGRVLSGHDFRDSRVMLPRLQEDATNVKNDAANIRVEEFSVVSADAHTLTRKKYKPGLYWSAGYKQIRIPEIQEEQKITEILRQLQPSIVFVAFGAPAQEEWVLHHLPELHQHGVKIVMVVGGAFDFLLGMVSRAPGWIQHLGLEWLYRLLRQPWRWRRQLRLIEFGWIVLRSRIWPRG